MRLDKFLCDMGQGTRSQVKDGIRRGYALVDGAVCRRPETQIGEQQVVYKGQIISYTVLEYYLLYKPAGVVSATEDRRERTVLDLIPDKKRKDLFPVGRLDKDTEGLLLITNDGPLAHCLLSPKKHVDKVYFARVEGLVTPAHVELFQGGLDFGEEAPALPARLEILKTDPREGVSEIRLTLREGRFHQVKRMMAAIGCPVTYLKRLSMGALTLDAWMRPGDYRPLTQAEVQRLKGKTEC